MKRLNLCKGGGRVEEDCGAGRAGERADVHAQEEVHGHCTLKYHSTLSPVYTLFEWGGVFNADFNYDTSDTDPNSNP